MPVPTRQIVPLIAVGLTLLLMSAGCGSPPLSVSAEPISEVSSIPIADSFSYPVGDGSLLTAAKDKKDGWFNALDFGEQDHLGEDWNGNSGGNSDCGEPVYAAANGLITFAGDAGPGWGNVVIITHRLPDGSYIQTLYGHLKEIVRSKGDVKVREKIGSIGNANGRYLCHLHLELRESSSPMWNRSGPGYSNDKTGWLDPSDFIDARIASNP